MRKRITFAGTLLATLLVFAAPAQAQEITLESVENGALVLYIMVASALVFIMHAGFSLVESGFSRAKNAANIVMKNLMTLCLGFLVYFAVGFALMYGSQVGGLIGTDGFFLTGLSEYEPLGGILAVDFLFQGMFAATSATIVSGAMAERMKLSAYLITIVVMTSLVYPVVGAWKWGGGWLDQLGFVDFAGSTLVHMVGGVAALVGVAILGPRLGKYAADGTPRVIPGHSMPLGILGVLLLFFGWFGFNGGSVLALDGPLIGAVLLTTALAGCAGGVAAAFFTRLRYGKFDVGMTGNGILAGLVGITAGADVVSNVGALAVGLIGGVVVAVAVPFLDRRKLDDPVGAIAVHGVCGILGTLWVGLASTTDGLLYGGGLRLLGIQAVGILAAAAYVAVAAVILFSVLKATIGLRVSEDEEIEGLDIHEHGMYAYPEAALGGDAYPAGPLTVPRIGHGVAREPRPPVPTG